MPLSLLSFAFFFVFNVSFVRSLFFLSAKFLKGCCGRMWQILGLRATGRGLLKARLRCEGTEDLTSLVHDQCAGAKALT